MPGEMVPVPLGCGGFCWACPLGDLRWLQGLDTEDAGSWGAGLWLERPVGSTHCSEHAWPPRPLVSGA